MGEVYRARDAQLGRDVALKVLPAQFVNDPDRVARFQREAKTLASLSHPNIGIIHGLEHSGSVSALVLELVEGPTLADRLAASRMELDEALTIAQQIASALEAAHEQGVIHRDLKPSNIKLRPDGTVKVLDFGLAKVRVTDAGTSDPHLSHSPTITSPAATQTGVIMGTAAYMSPEQARGRPVDKRTDIWAFGCVLYEMIAGRRPFSGEDVSEVLASILAREPNLDLLPHATPPSIRRLIRRCLRKDQADRLRDIGDARLEIRDCLSRTEADELARPPRNATRLAALGATLLVAVAAIGAMGWRWRSAPPPPEVRLDINIPQTSAPASVAISPDGRTMAYVATSDGQARLWLRPLDAGTARALPGTEGANYPFWAPDSRSIGFFADSSLKRIDLDGESIRNLSKVYRATGGTWSRSGVIVFSSLGYPISRVAATGGTPVEVPGLFQTGSNFTPHFLPDGNHFLYFVRAAPDTRGVYIGALEGEQDGQRLLESDAGAVYAASGHLIFVRKNTLFAQPFDAGSRQIDGLPVTVAQNVSNCPCVTVSTTGAIAYRAAGTAPRRQFVWFDRSGKELDTLADRFGVMSTPSFSPDGSRILGYRNVAGNIDVWSLEYRRGAYTRFTTHVADDVSPVWSPDGQHIAFGSNRNGPHDLYRKSATAGGAEELLLASPQQKFPTGWSSDGRYLLFDLRDSNSSSDVMALPLDGKGEPIPVAASPNFDEQRAQLSPDAKWVAYQSDESGRDEIYMQPFPGPTSTRWPISNSGGTQVRWRGDGRELFYVTLAGQMMSVSMQPPVGNSEPVIGTPVPLFAPPLGGLIQQGDFRHQYLVASDGRLLVGTMTDTVNVPITVILNWMPANQ